LREYPVVLLFQSVVAIVNFSCKDTKLERNYIKKIKHFLHPTRRVTNAFFKSIDLPAKPENIFALLCNAFQIKGTSKNAIFQKRIVCF